MVLKITPKQRTMKFGRFLDAALELGLIHRLARCDIGADLRGSVFWFPPAGGRLVVPGVGTGRGCDVSDRRF